MWPLYKRLLQRSTAPILCGPWQGEVGFEALYWVPFLKRLGIPKERLIPLTRGGAHLWYPHVQHVELYSLREPKEYRIQAMLRHKQTGMLKQQSVTAFDKALIKDAAKALGLTTYHVLHPHWMYRELFPFWEQRKGLAWLIDRAELSNLPSVGLDGVTIPPAFTAVRFYARSTFPMQENMQTVAHATVKNLAEHGPVILLNSGIHADDHLDFEFPPMPNVMKMTDLIQITPENNLSVQSALLSRAQAFVGTYGGLAQLALLYRKPSVSFYSDWHGTAIAHKHLMDAIALQMGVTAQVVRVHDIPILQAALPKIQVTRIPASSSGAQAPEPARLNTAKI